MQEWGDSVMAAVMAGAAVAGAVFMKFGSSFFKPKTECEADAWRFDVLSELQAIRHGMESQAKESEEWRKVIHSNTRVMDGLRQEVSTLRAEQGEMKGMLR